MDARQIIMNFTRPPGVDDLEVLANETLEILPEELLGLCNDLTVVVDDFPDEATEQELDIDDPYELLALYRSGKEISPGVERKTAREDDVILIYRRPVLDMWCETGDDLGVLIRQIMIEELGRHFNFSEDDIDEMSERHYQGMF